MVIITYIIDRFSKRKLTFFLINCSPEIQNLRNDVEALISRLDGLEKQNKESKKDKRDLTLTAMENVAELESYSIDQSTIVENPVKSSKKARRSVRLQQKKNMSLINNKMSKTIGSYFLLLLYIT